MSEIDAIVQDCHFHDIPGLVQTTRGLESEQLTIATIDGQVVVRLVGLHVYGRDRLATERNAREAAEAEVGKLHMQIEESKAYGLRQAMERLNEAKRAAVAEERAEAAEAAVARMREDTERLAARYDRIAADHQHNADLVGEASSTHRIHLNLAGSYRERADDVRALVGGETE